MAAEPITIIITAQVDFDGMTPFPFTRSDFSNPPNSYVYSITTDGVYGLVDSTMFGLLNGERPKLVGISANVDHPFALGRVIPRDSNTVDNFRKEVTLGPEVRYVVMYPGDKLALKTDYGRQPTITLVVNELSEADHLKFALSHQAEPRLRRFRIVRNAPTGFKLGLNKGLWRPAFVQNGDHVLVATEVDRGIIPLSSFCLFPQYEGCLIQARFANIQDKGHIHIVEPLVQSHHTIGGVGNMEWSKVAKVSHDDGIAIRSSDPDSAGDVVIVDIIVERVHPGALLQGLYDRGM